MASVDRCARAVEAAELDVLVYPEVGMHPPTYAMALRRLAPVQISTHGNSETSGLGDSIDYFVSFDDMEADGGVGHYTEQLVRLAGVHSLFTHPGHVASPLRAWPGTTTASLNDGYPAQVGHNDASDSHLSVDPTAGMTAVELLQRRYGGVCPDPETWAPQPGLPPTAHGQPVFNFTCARRHPDRPAGPLYLCPQTLYKLHPVFDGVVTAVLRADPCGRVVLLHGSSEVWDVTVVRRIADQLAADVGLTDRHTLFDPSVTAPDTMCAVLGVLLPTLSRLVIAPQRGHNAFLELLAVADVVVDSFPFGACICVGVYGCVCAYACV